MNFKELAVKFEELSKTVELQAAMIQQLEASIAKLEGEKPATAKSSSTKEGSIADTIVGLLISGEKPKDVLEAVKKKHPDCKTTLPCVYWYKTRVNKGLYNQA